MRYTGIIMDPQVLVSIVLGIEGLFIGSFLNVVVDRIPYGKSLGGRSSCDVCGNKLSPRELIPVFSYALQGGKSRCCKVKLKSQYSLVEAITGVLFFLTSYVFFSKGLVLNLVAIAPLFALLVTLSVSIAITIIDFRHHIIPDSLQVALFGGVIAYHLFQGTFQVTLFGEALIVALPILLLYLITGGRGMGYGDIKLQVTLGLLLGLTLGFLGLYLSFIMGALYGVYLMGIHKAGRKTHIAFGPFLLFGAWIVFWWGNAILKFAQQLLPY